MTTSATNWLAKRINTLMTKHPCLTVQIPTCSLVIIQDNHQNTTEALLRNQEDLLTMLIPSRNWQSTFAFPCKCSGIQWQKFPQATYTQSLKFPRLGFTTVNTGRVRMTPRAEDSHETIKDRWLADIKPGSFDCRSSFTLNGLISDYQIAE